jgi:hypothetical protein
MPTAPCAEVNLEAARRKLEEIDAWLASIPDDDHDLAERCYMRLRGCHVGGEPPKWMRVQWSQLPKNYRAFLASFVRMGIDNAKHVK